MNYKREELKDGMKVTCTINGKEITDAKLTISGSEMFICQNVESGSQAHDKKGYSYSWVTQIYDGFKEGNDAIRDFKIVTGKKEKVLPVLYVVTYDIEDRDPVQTFTSKKDMNEWLKEARKNSRIKFDLIKVYEVKKAYEIKVNFSLKLIK